MSAAPEGLRLVRSWVERAEEDLRSAEVLLEAREHYLNTAICFHAQQCVEKHLKALLTFLAIDFPRIHDLGELVRLVPTEQRPYLTVEEEERLTDYAAASRYPGDSEPISRAAANEAVAVARRVRQSVRDHLPPETLPPVDI